ncbi:Bifunctional chorismate mutase/prephenate dehydratase [Bienertia sinuspersici]
MASSLVHPKTRQTVRVQRINSKPKFETAWNYSGFILFDS